ncbi:MAG: cytochrome bc complex cytochrome b subunit [Thaumarchaeota archaeon]|nr:cytochrome bc complex cytochrome b subunit [Nitrososphaerota archaeon]
MTQNPGRRFVEWFKDRFGLSTSVLRPVPEYSMNPLYWLGALTAIAFGLQVLTGLLMLIYYVPTTDQAYSSTIFIIKSVPLGWLLETVHLYGAYAMILLTFLHLFRGYFVSVQKKPREMMWVLGMLMGLTVLGFGLTGYLLPWTVVSKSATDVSIGMLSFMPAQIGPILTFLVAGTGSGAAELTRFFDLHIIVLPAGLLSLLGLKLYMFEAHGAAKPVVDTRKDSKEIPWFPTVYLYFAMIGAAFVAVIFVAAAMFPINLPAEFTPGAASNYVAQPEWYFLWMYQVLKVQSFEGNGIYLALGAVTAAGVGLALLPFLDRGTQRNPKSRPIYTTIGFLMIAEILTLTVWGYFTPGQIIADSQAIIVNGGVAVGVVVVSLFLFRNKLSRVKNLMSPIKSPLRALMLPFTNRTITALFMIPLIAGSVCLANLVGSLTSVPVNPLIAIINFVILSGSFVAMARIMKTLTLARERRS